MQTYSISEMTKKCNLTASTLRYYEDIGLLPQVERSASKQRIYTQDHIDRIHAISCFKNTGMSISDIQKFFRYEAQEKEHIDDIVQLLEVFQEVSLKKLQEEIRAYAHLLRKIDYYHAVSVSYQEQSPHPLWEDYECIDYLQSL